MARIQFKFAAEKAWDAIHWIVSDNLEIDLHTLLKACYFADKAHLNEHGRPIFGATYRAMKFGPVPLEIYEMAKADPIWLAELGQDRYPWCLNGYRLALNNNDKPSLDSLSQSDKEAIAAGLEKSLAMSFTQRTAATHGPDWQAAKLGVMKYEDMLQDSDTKAELVEYLKEAAPVIRL